MTRQKRCAIYTRVSTGDQNPALQKEELTEYAERRGWQLVSTYSDTISGAKDKRPGLDKLMADAARRKFDIVAVWRFDRFARSTTQLLKALETFSSLGIDFVSLTEAIDTSCPGGKLVFTVLAGVAELERSIIQQRVIAGQRAAKAKGVRFGRPAIEVDTEQVRKLRRAGASIRAIATEMKLSKDTVWRALA
jgi:DNA invertase Pin-like site-specific DNA recombinase